jgi:CRISPR-associated endoribonuclease Cas6
MPSTAIINMRSIGSGPAPRSLGSLFYGFLLDRISMSNNELARSIHDSPAMAPFSLSPLMGRRTQDHLPENASFWVRIGFLQPRIEEVFLETLEQGLWSDPFDLGGLPFVIENVLVGERPRNLWSGRQSFEELLSGDGSSKKLSLLLASPMAFRRGDLHYPLPEPALIFDNLARRWNLFSPFKLPEKPDCFNVSYSNVRVETKPFALRKGGTVLGAVGKLTFIFAGSAEERLLFRALLRFAFYAGIGVKTTQGMGMCRTVSSDKTFHSGW